MKLDQRGVHERTQVMQSSLDGSPQCPTCWAHTMVQQANGSFRCPSGCHGFVIRLKTRRLVLLSANVERIFDGTMGDLFALCTAP